MRADPQGGAVMQQSIKHVRGFVAGRRHHAHAVGAVLVGDMRVETQARVLTVSRVHVAGGIAALCGAEELPVRRRCCAIAPCGCDWEPMVRVDDSGECCRIGFRARIGEALAICNRNDPATFMHRVVYLTTDAIPS